MKNELMAKAMRKEGVWVLSQNNNLLLFFPNAPDNERYQPLKILIKPDHVDVYTIWIDGVPHLDRFSRKNAYFEEVNNVVRFVTVGRAMERVSKEEEDERTNEEYLEWFVANHELTEEEYERIVIDGGKHLPAIEIERS